MQPKTKDLNFIQTLNDRLVRKDSNLDLSYERMGDAGIIFCAAINVYPTFKKWI